MSLREAIGYIVRLKYGPQNRDDVKHRLVAAAFSRVTSAHARASRRNHVRYAEPGPSRLRRNRKSDTSTPRVPSRSSLRYAPARLRISGTVGCVAPDCRAASSATTVIQKTRPLQVAGVRGPLD